MRRQNVIVVAKPLLKKQILCADTLNRAQWVETSIDNLRPICYACNQSMGQMNMELC